MKGTKKPMTLESWNYMCKLQLSKNAVKKRKSNDTKPIDREKKFLKSVQIKNGRYPQIKISKNFLPSVLLAVCWGSRKGIIKPPAIFNPKSQEINI